MRWNLCEYPERAVATVTRHAILIGRSRFSDEASLAAAWMHEIGAFTVADSLDGISREVALRECEAFWDGVLARIACSWLNEPGRIRTASNKLFQLRLAERLGLPIPDYCATNDPAIALDFAASKRRAIAKAVRGGFLVHSATSVKFFTRRFDDLGPAVYEAFKFGPLLLQEEVWRQREIRITVVDGQCFCMEIDCTNLPSGIVDVRELDFAEHRHRFKRATDTAKIENWSRQIVDALGLGYAGLDWAISVDGAPFFLECNPLGSFKWSEICTGQDITSRIADALDRMANTNPRSGC